MFYVFDNVYRPISFTIKFINMHWTDQSHLLEYLKWLNQEAINVLLFFFLIFIKKQIISTVWVPNALQYLNIFVIVYFFKSIVSSMNKTRIWCMIYLLFEIKNKDNIFIFHYIYALYSYLKTFINNLNTSDIVRSWL